jgi:hypothetical protein
MNDTGATEGLWGDTRAKEAETSSCARDGLEQRVNADEEDTGTVTVTGEEVKTGTIGSELAKADGEGREIETYD